MLPPTSSWPTSLLRKYLLSFSLVAYWISPLSSISPLSHQCLLSLLDISSISPLSLIAYWMSPLSLISHISLLNISSISSQYLLSLSLHTGYLLSPQYLMSLSSISPLSPQHLFNISSLSHCILDISSLSSTSSLSPQYFLSLSLHTRVITSLSSCALAYLYSVPSAGPSIHTPVVLFLTALLVCRGTKFILNKPTYRQVSNVFSRLSRSPLSSSFWFICVLICTSRFFRSERW